MRVGVWARGSDLWSVQVESKVGHQEKAPWHSVLLRFICNRWSSESMAFHELINHMYSFTISQKSILLLMLCMNHSCYQSRNRFQRNSVCKDEKCDQTHPNSILQLSTWAVGDHTKHTTYKHKISATKL
jgi:hypothetical protein